MLSVRKRRKHDMNSQVAIRKAYPSWLERATPTDFGAFIGPGRAGAVAWGIGKLAIIIALLVLVVTQSGCVSALGPRAENGVTFYCPGAGNIDFGDAGLREGLQKAGYRGEVATVGWTFSLNPAIDQMVRVNARLGASSLARAIEHYLDKHPNGEVNVVGLSAGTGVAIWALEQLDPKYKVNNVVLLASSLSHDYDVEQALRRVRGRIYNYYSPRDAVLAGPMKLFGTIDGKFFDQAVGAGEVGLQPPSGRERVVNIAWRPEFEKLGYSGGHTDATRPKFVQAQIAPQLFTRAVLIARDAALETAPALAARDARPR